MNAGNREATLRVTLLTSLAFLYGLAVLSRALLLTVLPLQAYDLLGDTQRVSLVYFAVSLTSMAAFLFMPVLVRQVPRRSLLLLGPLCLIGACCLFATAVRADGLRRLVAVEPTGRPPLLVSGTGLGRHAASRFRSRGLRSDVQVRSRMVL